MMTISYMYVGIRILFWRNRQRFFSHHLCVHIKLEYGYTIFVQFMTRNCNVLLDAAEIRSRSRILIAVLVCNASHPHGHSTTVYFWFFFLDVIDSITTLVLCSFYIYCFYYCHLKLLFFYASCMERQYNLQYAILSDAVIQSCSGIFEVDTYFTAADFFCDCEWDEDR